MFSQPSVWLCILLAMIAAIIPDILAKAIENLIERKEVNKLHKIETGRQQKNVSIDNVEHETKKPISRKNRKISNANIFNSSSSPDPRSPIPNFSNTRMTSFKDDSVSLIFKYLN